MEASIIKFQNLITNETKKRKQSKEGIQKVQNTFKKEKQEAKLLQKRTRWNQTLEWPVLPQ